MTTTDQMALPKSPGSSPFSRNYVAHSPASTHPLPEQARAQISNFYRRTDSTGDLTSADWLALPEGHTISPFGGNLMAWLALPEGHKTSPFSRNYVANSPASAHLLPEQAQAWNSNSYRTTDSAGDMTAADWLALPGGQTTSPFSGNHMAWLALPEGHTPSHFGGNHMAQLALPEGHMTSPFSGSHMAWLALPEGHTISPFSGNHVVWLALPEGHTVSPFGGNLLAWLALPEGHSPSPFRWKPHGMACFA